MSTNWRGWIIALHRDLGYFFTGVVVIYAISGIAVNHIDEWNPSFRIERRAVALSLPADASQITEQDVRNDLDRLNVSDGYRSFDFPSSEKIKIYLEDGDIVANLRDGAGVHEVIERRTPLYQFNLLHLNPKRWWKLFSDVFAGALILIALTGLFIARGQRGIMGRGKWLAGAGLIIPLAAMFVL